MIARALLLIVLLILANIIGIKYDFSFSTGILFGVIVIRVVDLFEIIRKK